MKIKKFIISAIVSIITISSLGVFTASAGQDDFIMPYYNGYAEDGATMLSQNTVIDMSGYNGAGGVGFDAGVITATSEYQLNVTQENAVFYLPYAGLLEDLNSLTIKVNDSTVVPELRFDDIEIKHQRHSGWHKEKAKISDEEIRQTLHPLQFYPTQFQERRSIISPNVSKSNFLSIPLSLSFHKFS